MFQILCYTLDWGWCPSYHCSCCCKNNGNLDKFCKIDFPYQYQSKSEGPDGKSFQILVHHYKLVLVLTGLQFFSDVACKRKGVLLSEFQSNSPLLLFLVDKLEDLFRDLLNIAVKPERLNKANTTYHSTKINISDKENRRLPETIMMPTAIKLSLRKTSLSQGVSI